MNFPLRVSTVSDLHHIPFVYVLYFSSISSAVSWFCSNRRKILLFPVLHTEGDRVTVNLSNSGAALRRQW